jgi:hypothetical protein
MSAGTVVVDGETAARSQSLGSDAEVALLPPVSGGAGNERERDLPIP